MSKLSTDRPLWPRTLQAAQLDSALPDAFRPHEHHGEAEPFVLQDMRPRRRGGVAVEADVGFCCFTVSAFSDHCDPQTARYVLDR
jgi:hypothetical protein